MLELFSSRPARVIPPAQTWREWPRSILPIVTALAAARAWASPTSPSARRRTRSKTACCGSSAAPASSPPRSPADRPADRAGIGPAMCSSPSTASRSTDRDDVLARSAAMRAPATATPTRCSASAAAQVVEVAMAPLPSGAGGALLRARRGRHLHAARRRRGADAPPVRSGDAALLLAQRSRSSARSRSRSPAASIASTGSSTGRTTWRSRWCRRSSCTSRSSFPSGRIRSGYTAMLARWLPAIYLPAAVLVLDAHRSRSCAPASIPTYFVRLIGLLDTLELLHLDGVPRRRSRRAGARARPRPLGDVDAPAALDCLGHGASACCRSRSATPAVRVSA